MPGCARHQGRSARHRIAQGGGAGPRRMRGVSSRAGRPRGGYQRPAVVSPFAARLAVLPHGHERVVAAPHRRACAQAWRRGRQTLPQILDFYRQVNDAVTDTWHREGHHAFLHHLNALFGYEPIDLGPDGRRRCSVRLPELLNRRLAGYGHATTLEGVTDRRIPRLFSASAGTRLALSQKRATARNPVRLLRWDVSTPSSSRADAMSHRIDCNCAHKSGVPSTKRTLMSSAGGGKEGGDSSGSRFLENSMTLMDDRGLAAGSPLRSRIGPLAKPSSTRVRVRLTNKVSRAREASHDLTLFVGHAHREVQRRVAILQPAMASAPAARSAFSTSASLATNTKWIGLNPCVPGAFALTPAARAC